jgi:hypothetical protein
MSFLLYLRRMFASLQAGVGGILPRLVLGRFAILRPVGFLAFRIRQASGHGFKHPTQEQIDATCKRLAEDRERNAEFMRNRAGGKA